MVSPTVKIKNADDMTDRWITAYDGSLSVRVAKNEWSWILVKSEHPDHPCAVIARQSEIEEPKIAGDNGHLATWFFQGTQDELVLNGLQGLEQFECFVGTLPKQLAKFVAHAEQVDRKALAQFLISICVNEAPDWQKVERFSDDAKFDLLHGCSTLARRLGLFRAEVTLIESALTIRQSKNMTRLLSYAYAHAQDYRRAQDIAEIVLKSDPAMIEGPFQLHLSELEAFANIGSELKNLAGASVARQSKTPPKTAYCLHNSLPFAQGGYAMRSHSLAEAIVSEGRELVAIARPGFPSDGHKPSQSPMGCETTDEIDYYFENSFGRKGRAYAYIAESADYFEKMIRTHEISTVHAATNFWTALPAAIAAQRLAIPFIYEVRSFWTDTREARLPGFSKTPQAKRDDMLETIVLAMADEIITLNAAMHEKLVALGSDPKRISIVPNCVDAMKFVPQPRDLDLAKQYRIGEQDIVIGYMGAMLGYEGLDLLVDAAAPLIRANSDIKLVLVGADAQKLNDPGSIEFGLRRQIERLQLGDNVILSDRVPPAIAREFYNLFDICAYPRRGFEVCERVSPLKPLEAMAAGKTVIASDVGGLLDMVSHESTGLVFGRENVSALRAALDRAIDDNVLRQQLGESARMFVASERNWKDAAKAVVTVYERADHGSGPDKETLARLVSGHFYA